MVNSSRSDRARADRAKCAAHSLSLHNRELVQSTPVREQMQMQCPELLSRIGRILIALIKLSSAQQPTGVVLAIHDRSLQERCDRRLNRNSRAQAEQIDASNL